MAGQLTLDKLTYLSSLYRINTLPNFPARNILMNSPQPLQPSVSILVNELQPTTKGVKSVEPVVTSQIPHLFTVKEASELLGITVQQVKRLVEFKKLPAIVISRGTLRFTESQLKPFLGRSWELDKLYREMRGDSKAYQEDQIIRKWERLKPRYKMDDTAVAYFIQMGNSKGPVKIGYTGDVSVRMRQMDTHSPYKLTLLAAVLGGKGIESLAHDLFREQHLKGEWFRVTKDLLRLAKYLGIDRVKTPSAEEIERRIASSAQS